MVQMLWLLLVLVGWTANVSQSADVSQSIFTELSHLPLDENDRLEQHYLLHSDNLECSAAITDRISRNEFLVRRVAPVGGKLATLYFGQTSSPCSAVCLTRGTHISSLGDPLPQHLYAGGDLDEWISKKCQRVEIGFILYAAEEAETYWVNSSGELHLVGSFLAGERNTAWHTTYLGHKFEIHEKGTGKLLGRYTAEYDSINPVGVRAENLFARDVTSLVKNTFDMEWRRAHTVQRTFTEFGFDKGRLPSDLWGSMSAFYYNNRHNKCSEEWEGKGVFVNWWESSVYFIPMPWGLKVILTSNLCQFVLNFRLC